MKIYRSITLALDGTVLDEDSYDYRGPVAEYKGGGTTTTQVTLPPPTANQLELERMQLQMFRQSSSAMPMQYASADPIGAQAYLAKGDFGDSTSPFFGLEKYPGAHGTVKDLADQYASNKDLYSKAQKYMQNVLEGKSNLSDEQKGNLDKMDASQRSQYSDLRRQYATETSGRLGLYTSDSPIQGDVARQDTQFQSNLAATRASSELNLGATNTNYAQNQQQTQMGMAGSAMNNRMVVGNQGLGMGGNLTNQYFANQRAGASNYQYATQPQGAGAGMIIGGIGAAASVGALALAI